MSEGTSMAEVHESGEVGASVDEVWKLVGDFGGFPQAMGVAVELEGEGIGQTRKISAGRAPMVERLQERDEDAKRLVYSIVEGALPVTDYRSTMQLSAAGGGRAEGRLSAPVGTVEGTALPDTASILSPGSQG